MTSTNDFHEANKASEVLSKIGSGAADADFARAIHEAIDRAQQTMKKAKVRVEVEIDPDEERGSLFVRARVTAKLPELPPPASQMHVGEGGALMTQQEWMWSGKDESLNKKPKPVETPPASPTPSGRFPVAKAPDPAPVASAPTPKPVTGKES